MHITDFHNANQDYLRLIEIERTLRYVEKRNYFWISEPEEPLLSLLNDGVPKSFPLPDAVWRELISYYQEEINRLKAKLKASGVVFDD